MDQFINGFDRVRLCIDIFSMLYRKEANSETGNPTLRRGEGVVL